MYTGNTRKYIYISSSGTSAVSIQPRQQSRRYIGSRHYSAYYHFGTKRFHWHGIGHPDLLMVNGPTTSVHTNYGDRWMCPQEYMKHDVPEYKTRKQHTTVVMYLHGLFRLSTKSIQEWNYDNDSGSKVDWYILVVSPTQSTYSWYGH